MFVFGVSDLYVQDFCALLIILGIYFYFFLLNFHQKSVHSLRDTSLHTLFHPNKSSALSVFLFVFLSLPLSPLLSF